MPRHNRKRVETRRGTATVEFAVVAPLFLLLTLGLLQGSKLFDSHSVMAQAARDGARLGAMDRADWVSQGINSNDKIKQDVRNTLAAAGFDPEDVDVFIEFPGEPGNDFDLDDPANDFELFELRIEVPLNPLVETHNDNENQLKMVSKVVFRNSKSTIVQ
ncbi:TadE/TadG family type IV pilus assembly protein [Blastopirellula retiformator]|uniref:TadE-like protein n=1 Tax=Blastopirellula retiformator TaxID=2527970 RepID=A0A5C5V563_9BACT|nr:TadE family protein [Blastopirellula retiformator]TWT32917.1 TadE-like protein [Blastopirellula retiformator]